MKVKFKKIAELLKAIFNPKQAKRMKKSTEFLRATKLHELLGFAIEDLSTCIGRGLEVNMNCWVYFNHEEPCAVCLAGAVMVERFAIKRGEEIPLHDWRFKVLNYLRQNAIVAAFLSMQIGNDIPEDLYQKAKKIENLDLLNYSKRGLMVCLNDLHFYLKRHDL